MNWRKRSSRSHWTPPSPLDHVASSELPMHRAIYRQTEANAVFHGHGRFSIIESLTTEAAHVTPVDSESAYYLPVIPIIEGPSGTEELGTRRCRP